MLDLRQSVPPAETWLFHPTPAGFLHAAGARVRHDARHAKITRGGYVSAYTTTKLGALGVEEKKVANPELFFWQRVTWTQILR